MQKEYGTAELTGAQSPGTGTGDRKMHMKSRLLPSEQSEFRATFFRTIIPLLVSSVFTQSLTFVDQWMVNTMGAPAVAAVGVASSFFGFFFCFLYGCNSGAGIYLTRYWGRGDIRKFQKMMWIVLTSTVIIGSIICSVIFFFPDAIIHLYTQDELVISYARPYLKVVALSNVLNAFCMGFSFMFQNMGKTMVPMYDGIFSMLGNVFLNYIFIFGKLGLPRFGVVGAAYGTLITRIGEIIGLMIYFHVSDNPVKKNFTSAVRELDWKSYRAFFRTSLPLCANDMLWAVGLSIYYMVYGTRGTEVYAAMSILDTLEMVAKLVIMGFARTCTVMLGIQIGRGDPGKIDRYSRQFNYLSRYVGLISSASVLALLKPIQYIYGLSGTFEGECVWNCMLVLSVSTIFNAVNCIKVEGIFRCGGDVFFLTFMDSGSIWLIGLPVTLLLGLVFKADIWFVYAAHIAVELYKLPLGQRRLRSGKWLHAMA